MAGFFFAEIGTAESFAREIGAEVGRGEFDYGQAAAVYRDAVAEFGVFGDGGIISGSRVRSGCAMEADPEAAAGCGVVEGFDLAYLFGDAYEHLFSVPVINFAAA